ncbi:amidase family protein [Neobacillus terrae]|uniref:amidase family protein n=1 Tax=Neobacillus terrae TaxID=3034837 RepID=UPI00140BDE0C|nr:amidase family protein [Neobacillus terrae]NHM32644.1 amidase [Neobacillus terrae]
MGLAELIKKKEVKKEEVIEAATAKIERINPELNAVIHKTYEHQKVESENATPFAGVPILLKDIIQEIKGEPITSGSRALRGYIAKEDSEFVSRMRGTGTRFLGVTNVPELALMGITEPVHYGPSRNPWNTDHTPGGSSGGSAAAVASGMVPIAGANDGGGSIRIPAAFTGLFGLKPSRGRTPVGKRLGRHWQGASADHVLTRTVRDSAYMLDLLKGHEKGAAFHAPPFDHSYLESMNKEFNRPMKIAFSVASPIGTEVHPECKEAVMKTARLLEGMGHEVTEKNAPVDGQKIAKSYITMYFGEVAAALASMEEILGRKVTRMDVEPTTWLLGLLGKVTSAEEWVLSLREWDIASYAMESFHENFDFYVTPATAFPASRIGELDPSPSEKRLISMVGRFGLGGLVKKAGIVDTIIENSLKRTPFTQLANLTGQPAMSVPLHMTADGLPIGVQFMAAGGREDLLYQMAGTFEQTEYWQDVKKNPMFLK